MKIPNELKTQAMDAIKNVNTVTQIGMLKTLGAIAVYSALIHERDHAARNRAPKQRKDAVGRNV